MDTDPEDLSWMLHRVKAGEVSTEQLLERVYAELRVLAGHLMNRERGHHTLQPTALVNEAYLRLSQSPSSGPQDRVEILAAAACAMRRVLVDHARARNTDKRGGSWQRVTLMGLAEDSGEAEELDLIQLEEALVELARLDPRQAHIVELRFFSGLTGQEIADHLGISRGTVVRELTLARAWLKLALRGTD